MLISLVVSQAFGFDNGFCNHSSCFLKIEKDNFIFEITFAASL